MVQENTGLTGSEKAASLLRGAIDAHVHAAPDVQPRQLDCLGLVQEARGKGMGGVLLKDHSTLTSDRAYVLNQTYSDFKVYGSITLNDPVGGINPAAAEAAIRLGCREIFMPTYGARHHVSLWGKGSGPSAYPFSSNPQGISPIGESGKLKPEVQETLRLIAQADILLGTGHLSPSEIQILLRGAKEAGVKRILITHASLPLIRMSVEDQKEAVRLGSYIEHSFISTTQMMAAKGMIPIEEIAFQIRSLGAGRCVMSTDFGQTVNPSPVKGLEEFIRQMLLNGFPEEDITRMVRDNPRNLLEK
jgi:hypothetical protein